LGIMMQDSVAQNRLFIPDTLKGEELDLTIREGSFQFLPGQKTNTFGINGEILAPTLILEKHQHVVLNVFNTLKESTTIHWHGMHVSPDNDGGPHIIIPPGATWRPEFEVLDWASTYWYHPHLHEKTNEHVQKGIAGMIIVRDEVEAAIDLPRTYGVDDFPIMIQSKAFDSNNQILFESPLDSFIMVNGTIDPFVEMPAQIVRLRMLNGSSERAYYIGLTNNKTFHQIGSDGGLLAAPVPLSRLLIAPGERAEILIDFSGLEGQTLNLINYGQEIPAAIYGSSQPGMGPGMTIPGYSQNLKNGRNFEVLKIEVIQANAQKVEQIPTELVEHVIWSTADVNETRSLVFMPEIMGPNALTGNFMINGNHFDMERMDFEIPFENIEIWELRNQSPIAHPFHIHDVQFYVLSINGSPPPENQRGRKDVILVPAGNSVVRFITRFETFFNDSLPYMFHCHMLTHEDHGMMGQFLVLPPTTINNQEVSAEQFNISLGPNPAHDHLILIGEIPNQIIKFQIYDISGKIVLEDKLIGNNNHVDISGFSLGTYYISFSDTRLKPLVFIKQ
jgi:FtsP/CotA-like multicopper oxidase with cupredoxin domain